MAIHRTKKISNFTLVDNILIEDKNLTLKEKGMMLILLRLPDNWEFSVNGLSTIIQESRNTTNSLLKSLENKKYLLREPIYRKGQRGIAEWRYNIFESVEIYENYLDTKNLDINNLDINNLDINNCIQINTNINKYEYKQILNESKEKNKKEKQLKKTYGKYRRIKLTDKEYENLIELYGKELIEEKITKLDEYVESNNNKNKYTNFNLVIQRAIRERWWEEKTKQPYQYENETTKTIKAILNDEVTFEPLPEFDESKYLE